MQREWYSIDVSSAVQSDGIYTFLLKTSTKGKIFGIYGKESPHKPILTVTPEIRGPDAPPTLDFRGPDAPIGIFPTPLDLDAPIGIFPTPTP